MTPIRFPEIAPAERDRLLAGPSGRVRVVIDTDAANEIDDQYALTWALLSPDRIAVEAIVAAPYSFAHLRPDLAEAAKMLENGESSGGPGRVDDLLGWAERIRAAGVSPDEIDFPGPAEGMEESFREVGRVLAKLGVPERDRLHRGATSYLRHPARPIESEGARKIVESALASADEPLYVLAIGCLTNVASALLMEPEIVRRVVVVWTSGYPTAVRRSNQASLNLVQDPLASRLLFDSGVSLVYLPGYYIGAQLRVSLPDVDVHVRGHGEIGDYLYHLYTHNPIHAQRGVNDLFGRTWVMWDMIDVAWVLEPRWVPSHLVPAPTLDDDLRWASRPGPPHEIREAYEVDRDAIFRDFFEKLAARDAILEGAS